MYHIISVHTHEFSWPLFRVRSIQSLFWHYSKTKRCFSLDQRKWEHKTEIRQECWHLKKNEKLWFEHISNAIFLNNILDYRKIGKFSLECMLFLQNMILNRAKRPILYEYRQIYMLLRNLVVSWSFLHEFEIWYGRCFTKEFTASIKKIELKSLQIMKSFYSLIL